jgi:hypothetical protein
VALIIWLAAVEQVLNAMLPPVEPVAAEVVDKEQDRVRLIQQVQLIPAVVGVAADIGISIKMVLLEVQVL